jgi:ribosomal protein S27AE
MEVTGPAPKLIRFAQATDLELNKIAATTFRAELDTAGEIIRLQGICPKCGHDMTFEHQTKIALGIAAEAEVEDLAALSVTAEIPMSCKCGQPHPKAPEDQPSCGRCWQVQGSWTGTAGLVALAGSAHLADCEEAMDLQELQRTELERVRKAAENWRTGLAGILALVTTVSIVKGKDTITGLASPHRIVLGIVLVITLGLAAIAALLALRAAYGSLEQTKLDRSLVALRAAEVRTALTYLKWTRGLTVAALVLLASSVGLLWYGKSAPKKPPALVQVVTTVTSGGVTEEGAFCGELVRFASNSLTIKTDTGDRRLDMGSVTSLILVEECGSEG